MEIKGTARRRTFRAYNAYVPYLFIAPFMIILLSFSLFPIINTVFLSFTNWDGLNEFSMVGIDNYARLLNPDTSRFFLALRNTALILLMYLPISICVALVISEILCGTAVRFKKYLQISFFSPYLTAPVALGLIFSILFDWKYGTINRVITTLFPSYDAVNFLGVPIFAQIVLAGMMLWKNSGYFVVMFMAGITAIPQDYYEAAEIDGANTRQRFFKITLPLLKPVLTFIVMTSIIYGFQLFDEPFLLFSGGFARAQPFGGPMASCLTLVMDLYDSAFRSMRFGFASASAISMFVMIFIVSRVAVLALERGGKS